MYWYRDNSKGQAESVAFGIPVVSFSLGDARVMLESGDVLVFGAASRLILHSVTKLSPGTAPKALRMGRPGRVNMTFRDVL